MPTLIALGIGLPVWIILWATGLKAFDSFLILLTLVLVAATVKSLLPYLPGNRPQD